jgi:hypothetical protein
VGTDARGLVSSIGASSARSERVEPISLVKSTRAGSDRCAGARDPRPMRGQGLVSVGLVGSVAWLVGWLL